MHSLTIKSLSQNMEPLVPLLYSHINWGWEEQDDSIVIHFPALQQLSQFQAAVQDLCADFNFAVQKVREEDWSEDWKKYFTPIEIDNTFIILPEWLKDTHSDLIKIVITPKMAFGTGHHPTTSLCLSILSNLRSRKLLSSEHTFLDLGTGSGILGIACSKLGLKGMGIDMDPIAVDNAQENIALNNVRHYFSVETKGIEELQQDRKYNIIFANILASTLKDSQKTITGLLDESHCLILSGILIEQVSDVLTAYQSSGLGQPVIMEQGEWSAIAWINL